MRRIKNYEIEREYFDEPAITFRDFKGKHIVGIKAGNLCNVELEVFRENEFTYVLSWNHKFPYIGIEKFLGNESRGFIFLYKKDDIYSVLGMRTFELAPINLAKRMADYLNEIKNTREKDA